MRTRIAAVAGPVVTNTTTDNSSSLLLSNVPQEAEAVSFRSYIDGASTNTGDVTVTKTVSGTASGASGRVRLTLNNSTSLVTGNPVTVTGVLGTTEANGTFAANVIDGTHIDLIGTAFANAYTSGGSVAHTTRNNAVWRQGFNIDVNGNAVNSTKELAFLCLESHYVPDATINATEGYWQTYSPVTGLTWRPVEWQSNLVNGIRTLSLNADVLNWHKGNGSTSVLAYSAAGDNATWTTGMTFQGTGATGTVAVFNQPTPGSFNLDVLYQSNGTNKWFMSVRTASSNDYWIYNQVVNAQALTIRSSDSLVTLGQCLLTASYTVATLPAAATVGAGARAFVTDANATMTAGIGATVAGGGANKVPVYSDGTNWKIG